GLSNLRRRNSACRVLRAASAPPIHLDVYGRGSSQGNPWAMVGEMHIVIVERRDPGLRGGRGGCGRKPHFELRLLHTQRLGEGCSRLRGIPYKGARGPTLPWHLVCHLVIPKP